MVIAGGWRYTRPASVLTREAVKEEAAAGHELHGIDSRRGRRTALTRESSSAGIGAHVPHGGDALGQQVAQVEAKLLAGAAAGEEEQMDVAVDQPGNQPLALGIDDPRAGRDRAFAGAPAQRIRSPRTRVTAFVTGARPVPSHRLAPTMAMEGLTGGGGTSLARGAPQAAAARRPAEERRVTARRPHGQPAPSCLERRRPTGGAGDLPEQ